MRLPAPARWFVRLLSEPDQEEVAGDLQEVHARRLARMGRTRAFLATSLEAGRIVSLLVGTRAMAWAARLPVSLPEVRLALRVTARHPLLSAAAVSALTVAIGLATALFTVASGVIWSSLPFPNGDRFVDLDFRTVEQRFAVPPPLEAYRAFRDQASLIDDVGAYRTVQLTLTGGDVAARAVSVAYLTPRSFSHFQVPPESGRFLVPGDLRGSESDVVVIRADLWRSRWGGDPSLIGRTVFLGGRSRTVVGVMPEEFGFPLQSEAWIPLDEATLGGGIDGAHARVEAYAVLAPQAARDVAQEQLQSLLQGSIPPGGDPLVVTVREFTRASTGSPAIVVGLVVGLLLILGLVASNVANLILTRTASRWSELSVRSALGATRGRLVSQIVLEVLILVGMAAALGLWGARGALSWLLRTVDDFPFWADLSPSWDVAVFVTLAGGVACLIAGVLPALRLTSGSALPSAEGKSGQRGEVRFSRFSATMVIVQVSICVALLSGALVMGEGLRRYTARNPVVPGDEILTTRVYFDPPVSSGGPWVTSQPEQLDSIRAVYARVSDAIRGVPGIRSVGFATDLPGSEAGLRRVQVDGLTEQGEVEAVAQASVSPGFFETLGIRPIEGRVFGTEGAEDEVIVNRPFVEAVLHGQNALGRRIRFADAGDDAPWLRIVGVVPDLDMSPADPDHQAGIYRPIDVSNLFYAVVRPSPDAMDVTGNLLVEAATVADPEVRVDEIMLLTRAGWESRALLGALMTGFGGVGLVTLLLSLIGLYAIMSYSVTRRHREIGIRIALGSPRAAVLRAVLRRAALQVAIGAAFGLLLAAGLSSGMRVLPIRLGDAGLWPGTLTAGLMLLAGLAAAWVPARRALRVSPLEALRSR